MRVYTRDEVLRQIKVGLSPSDFFEAVFESPVRNDELVLITDFLKFIDRKEFASVFKRLIAIKDIELCSPDRSISNRLAISPPKLDFRGTETRHISIINMYQGSMRVEFFTSGSAIVRPQTAILQQYLETRVAVQLTGSSTTVEIRPKDGGVIVPLRRLKEHQRPERVKAPKFFKIDQKLIDFGFCETGGVRKINVAIVSLTERTLSLHIFSLERSWKLNEKVFDLPTTIRISPFSKTEFVIEFRPSMETDFHEAFLSECAQQKCRLRVSGRGILAQ